MRRRDAFIALLALVAVAEPMAAIAQPRAGAPKRIGLVPDFSVPLWQPFRSLFVESMQARGWVEGRDYVIVQSGIAPGPQIEEAAQRIVAEKPDLIFTASTAYAVALHRVTKTIPIVMFGSGFPVEAGVAHSLARPGKNVTGLSIYAGTEVFGKLLQLVRELRPEIRRFGVLWSYVPPAFPREEIEPCYRELRRAAASLGLIISIAEIDAPERLPAALAQLTADKVEALFVTAGPPLWPIAARVTEYAVARRLPTIADFAWTRDFVPLIVYAPSNRDLISRAASQVDRILKGAKPGDLPIEQPAKFEMVINLKTANALGLKVPQGMLLRADRVIE
jgi:putative ABC transport system substrate-binding protein